MLEQGRSFDFEVYSVLSRVNNQAKKISQPMHIDGSKPENIKLTLEKSRGPQMPVEMLRKIYHSEYYTEGDQKA